VGWVGGGGGGWDSAPLGGWEQHKSLPSFLEGFQFVLDAANKRKVTPEEILGILAPFEGRNITLACSLQRAWPPTIPTLQNQLKTWFGIVELKSLPLGCYCHVLGRFPPNWPNSVYVYSKTLKLWVVNLVFFTNL